MPHSESFQALQLQLDTEHPLCPCFARIPEVLSSDAYGFTYHLSIEPVSPKPVKCKAVAMRLCEFDRTRTLSLSLSIYKAPK